MLLLYSCVVNISVISKGFKQAFGNGFAHVKIFFRLLSPLLSAAAELRALTPDLCNSILCSRVCPEL